MRRVARFVRLSFRDKRLIIDAGAMIIVIRLALWILPFSSTRRFVSRLSSSRSLGQARVDQIAWAVEVGARMLSVTNCLTKALAAHVLLLREGHESNIRIGVARDAGGKLIAHAWVESKDHTVVGGDELEKYAAASGSGQIG